VCVANIPKVHSHFCFSVQIERKLKCLQRFLVEKHETVTRRHCVKSSGERHVKSVAIFTFPKNVWLGLNAQTTTAQHCVTCSLSTRSRHSSGLKSLLTSYPFASTDLSGLSQNMNESGPHSLRHYPLNIYFQKNNFRRSL
jgi:hypothetical protein